MSVRPRALLARGPVHPTPTEEMQVDVLYRLLRIRTVVENGAVTVRQPLVGGNFLRHQEQVPNEGFVFLGQVIERGDRLAGYNQDVRRSLGVDIAQSHALVILIKNLPRLLSVHDLLKQRLLCHKGSLVVKSVLLKRCWATHSAPVAAGEVYRPFLSSKRDSQFIWPPRSGGT